MATVAIPEPFTKPADLERLRTACARCMPGGRAAARLPEELHRLLLDLQLYRLWIPRRHGGLERPLAEALATYEAVAAVDAALGWSVMIGAGGGLFAAFLPPTMAYSLFARPDALVAGSGAVGGSASAVPGGYRASGRWRYASGADLATVFTANCRTETGVLALAFKPADVRIERTWDTTGLRATGSHDMVVEGVFVPAAATFTLAPSAAHESGPLYRIPFGMLTELPVSAVVLGAAAGLVAAFEALSAVKPLRGGGGMLQSHPVVQSAMQACKAALSRARTELFALAAQAWQAALQGAIPETLERRCTSTCAQQVRAVLRAAGELPPLAGMNAIHATDPLAIAWQDLQAVTAHYSVAPLAGK